MQTEKALTLAFIAPRFPEAGAVGGAETLIRNLADYCSQQGHQVDFLTTCAKNHFTWANEIPAGESKKGKLNVHYFPVDEERDLETFLGVQESINRQQELSLEEEQAWLANSIQSSALIDFLSANKDKYHAILVGPYLFGLTHSVSEVAPKKTMLIPCLHDECFAYLQIMEALFTRCASLLFNAPAEQALAQRLYNIDADKCHVVGMGLEPFNSNAEAFCLRRKIKQPYIIYCGRREPMKGTPLLIDYFQLFRERSGIDLQLLFTGSGDIEVPSEIEKHVHDLGYVSEEEKHSAMAGATAFIHPSINESFGIVLMESWLARSPVIVHAQSDVLRAHCKQSNGGLWFNTYPEFETMLLNVLNNDSLRQQLGENGRAYVRSSYSWDAVGKKLFTALATL